MHIGMYIEIDMHVCVWRYVCVYMCGCVSRFLQFIFWKLPFLRYKLILPTTFIGFSQPLHFIRELAGKRHLSHTLHKPVRLSRESDSSLVLCS